MMEKAGIGKYTSAEECIRACFGEGIGIKERLYVGGGDINDACCLELDNGQRVFVKENTVDNYGFFEAEEYGLRLIEKTRVIRTPKLLGKGIDREKGASFLMMEMAEPAPQRKDFWEVFGRELAGMHLADTSSLLSP